MRFKREMDNDIDLIFSRINDRLNDFDDRIRRLQNDYGNVKSDVEASNEEMVNIQKDVDIIRRDLQNTGAIQNEVILDLEERMRNTGIFVGDRWRIMQSQSNNNFFFSDVIDGGFYRFLTTGEARDVDTF